MITWEQAKQIFQTASLPLYEAQYYQLHTYLKRLVEANQHMNLTAITEPEEVWTKHFLDSAVLLQQTEIPLGAACLDVGTGAGFPGMVLAILRPDLQMILLDSLQKRIGFLEETAEVLGLGGVRCVHARAEDAAKETQFREQFDFVTARAVAPLPILAEYCLPFVKLGGVFAAMKGPKENAAEAEGAVEKLGGAFAVEREYSLAGIGQRRVYLMEKRSHTPEQYPRRGDKIRKKPL